MVPPVLRSGGRLWRGMFWLAVAGCAVLAVLPKPPRLPLGSDGDKFEHALAFAVLATLARLASTRSSNLVLWLALAVFGAAIEFVQSIPPLHRDSGLDDWLVDAAVAAVVLGTWALVHRNGRAAPER